MLYRWPFFLAVGDRGNVIFMANRRPHLISPWLGTPFRVKSGWIFSPGVLHEEDVGPSLRMINQIWMGGGRFNEMASNSAVEFWGGLLCGLFYMDSPPFLHFLKLSENLPGQTKDNSPNIMFRGSFKWGGLVIFIGGIWVSVF